MVPKIYWVGLNLVKGIGAVRFQALLDYFGAPELAWNAPLDALIHAGLPKKIAENLVCLREKTDLERVWGWIEKQGIQVFVWDDKNYPRRLKEIDHPPPILYVRGTIIPEDEWAVSIVGTRQMTAYGRQVTAELTSHLVNNGITVVSGLARGVDAIAHESAIKAGGRTLAVLGCGVDRIYPPEHYQMAERVMQQGAMLSDYAPGTPPESPNFPPRNRIISGLSLATVVVEAGIKSGALITATFAVNQGREVFAVPGGIYAPQSKGTNRLIQQGARPLLSVEEVLDALNIRQVQQQQTARKSLPTDPVEEKLLQALGNQPMHVDDISVLCEIPVEMVSATLIMMELKGMVRQAGTMSYLAVCEETPTYQPDSRENFNE